MPRPDQTPRLPKWPFLVGDAVLLGAAWLIATHSARPFSGEAVLGIVVCAVAAGLAGVIPFLTDYAHRQDEALDERQRALEALGRSTATAAEQIGIAASGYHQVAELAEASLRQAGQVEQQLQKTGSEIIARLAAARTEEKKKLEKDFAALRAAEVERLGDVLEKLSLAVADAGRLEALLQDHVAAVAAAARPPAAPPGVPHAAPHSAPPAAPTSATLPVPGDLAPPASPTALTGPAETAGPAKTDGPAESAATLRPAEAATAAETAAPAKAAVRPGASEPAATPSPGSPPAMPGPAESAAATKTAAPAEPEAAAAAPLPPAAEPGVEPETPKASPRKRARKTPKPEEGIVSAAPAGEAAVDLFGEPARETESEFSQSSPDETAPAISVSADGSTRILVTAYIGIGNRLFIRGEGPGLSWDHGNPLQFVSIGKWRWESQDATAPVRFKLYKNDDIECAALGAQSVDPGHQKELTATF